MVVQWVERPKIQKVGVVTKADFSDELVFPFVHLSLENCPCYPELLKFFYDLFNLILLVSSHVHRVKDSNK